MASSPSARHTSSTVHSVRTSQTSGCRFASHSRSGGIRCTSRNTDSWPIAMGYVVVSTGLLFMVLLMVLFAVLFAVLLTALLDGGDSGAVSGVERGGQQDLLHQPQDRDLLARRE